MTDEQVMKALRAPFKCWRDQRGNIQGEVEGREEFLNGRKVIFYYIDARAVMKRLDAVLGVFGWDTTFSVLNDKIVCHLTIISPDGRRVTKTDGTGEADLEVTRVNKTTGEVKEMSEKEKIMKSKGDLSNALRRVAVSVGIGRYLYEGRDPVEEYNEWVVKRKAEKAAKEANKANLDVEKEGD